jgi:hypothetical protein
MFRSVCVLLSSGLRFWKPVVFHLYYGTVEEVHEPESRDKFSLIIVTSVCVLSVLSLMLSAIHLKHHRAHFF